MASVTPHDIHDVGLIQMERLALRYRTSLAATPLGGHPVRTLCVDWNSTGDILASSAEDGTVHLWSLQDTRRIAQSGFAKHSLSVPSVVWSPVEPYALGTASLDQGVLLWDHRDSGVSPTSVFGPFKGATEPIFFDFSSDGSKIAILTSISRYAYHLTIYDARHASPISPPIRIPFTVTSFEWIHSSNLLLAGTSIGQFWVVSAAALLALDPSAADPKDDSGSELSTNEMVKTMTIYAHNAAILTIQAKNNVLISGGSDSMIFVWDTESLACIKSFSHADNSVRSASISQDSQVIASAYEKEIALYASSSFKPLGALPNPSWTVSWHPWRPIIAFGGESSRREGQKYPGNLAFVNFDA